MGKQVRAKRQKFDSEATGLSDQVVEQAAEIGDLKAD
jgi:hypothetical protein